MIYVNNAELEKIFGSSSNITFSTVQVEIFSTIMTLAIMVAAVGFVSCGDDDEDDVFSNAQEGTVEGFKKTLCGMWEIYTIKANNQNVDLTFLSNKSKYEFKKDGSYSFYSASGQLYHSGTWEVGSFDGGYQGDDYYYEGIFSITPTQLHDALYKDIYQNEQKYYTYNELVDAINEAFLGIKMSFTIDLLFQNYMRISKVSLNHDGKKQTVSLIMELKE